MSLKNVLMFCRQGLRASCAAFLAAQLCIGAAFAPSAQAQEEGKARTPVKHVIVLIGENRTFDHVFATYQPKRGESVKNLLSEGIVKSDGTPGPNFSKAQQFQAVAPFRTKFFISLDKNEKTTYQTLPEPTLNFAPTATIFPPGTPAALLSAVEPSLESGDEHLLTTGAATGFPQTFVQPDPDTRVAN